MTNLIQVQNIIKHFFEIQPLVNEVKIGSIYDNLNTGNIKYPVINIDNASVVHSNIDTYSFYIYFADRLLETNENTSEIHTTGINVLKAFTKYVEDNFSVDGDVTITPFVQKFADNCAGVWMQINLKIEDDIDYCENAAEISELYIVRNGEYDVTNYERVIVNVIPQWGTIEGNIQEQEDLQAEFATKQDKLTAGEGIEITDDNVINNTKLPVWGEITGDIENQTDLVEYVDDKISETTDVTIGTITPTTTNFVEGETYSVQEAVKRTADLFAGQQGEIDVINSKIPNQATSTNQLADKAFVNATIATQTANFRGSWNTWSAVPTDASLYPEDYAGNRTPSNNDYLVIQDASDYPLDMNKEIYVHFPAGYEPTKTVTVNEITKEATSKYNPEPVDFDLGDIIVTITNDYWNSGHWLLSFNKDVKYNDVIYPSGETINIVGYYDEHNLYLYYSDGSSLSGQWRFLYTGDWDTVGKDGWHPAYQIGTAFTQSQQAAIDSTATVEKINQIGTNKTNITALQTDKLDKVYSSGKKLYGVANDGSQKMYTAGTNVQLNDNGTISATDTIYDDTEIRGMIEDIADEVDTKQNELTPGDNITIENDVISATVPTKTSDLTNDSDFRTGTQVTSSINSHNTSSTAHSSRFNAKQDKLVSGTNIKTINGNSLLGSGNINLPTINKGEYDDVDLDELFESGIYHIISGYPLPPMDSSYGQLFVINGDDGSYPTQIFSVEGDDNLGGNDVWYRKCIDGEWTYWTKFTTVKDFNKLNNTVTFVRGKWSILDDTYSNFLPEINVDYDCGNIYNKVNGKNQTLIKHIYLGEDDEGNLIYGIFKSLGECLSRNIFDTFRYNGVLYIYKRVTDYFTHPIKSALFNGYINYSVNSSAAYAHQTSNYINRKNRDNNEIKYIVDKAVPSYPRRGFAYHFEPGERIRIKLTRDMYEAVTNYISELQEYYTDRGYIIELQEQGGNQGGDILYITPPDNSSATTIYTDNEGYLINQHTFTGLDYIKDKWILNDPFEHTLFTKAALRAKDGKTRNLEGIFRQSNDLKVHTTTPGLEIQNGIVINNTKPVVEEYVVGHNIQYLKIYNKYRDNRMPNRHLSYLKTAKGCVSSYPKSSLIVYRYLNTNNRKRFGVMDYKNMGRFRKWVKTPLFKLDEFSGMFNDIINFNTNMLVDIGNNNLEGVNFLHRLLKSRIRVYSYVHGRRSNDYVEFFISFRFRWIDGERKLKGKPKIIVIHK